MAVIEIHNFAFENILKPKNQILSHADRHNELLGKDANFID